MSVYLGFDPNWTAQQALEAGADGPTSPFHRWGAWHLMDEYRISYEAGRNEKLFAALSMCARHDLPMPEWVAAAYLQGHRQWNHYHARSLDEAFGVQIPKGTHIARLRKNLTLWITVPLKVREFQKQGRPIDETLFRDVGLALNVSGSTARDAYYKSSYRKLLQEKR